MVSEAPRPLHLPLWRVRATILLGVGIMCAGGILGLTFRPSWAWAPTWLVEGAPYAATIGCVVLGLAVLGDVWPWARRLWRTVAGSLLLVAGAAMLVLPGPGLVTIGAGLFVLSREYAWAHRHYRRVTQKVHLARRKLAERRAQRAHLPPARHGTVVRSLRPVDGRTPTPDYHRHRDIA